MGEMERFGLLTFVLIVALGVVSRQYIARYTHIPYTVIMMLCGGIVGLLFERRINGHELESPTMRAWYNFDLEVLLYTFIPILVFESAFSVDTHVFRKIFWQIFTLAGPGVLVASILTATFVKYAFVRYDWGWPVSLMFGAIMSATDPVAVVSLLKELGVSERLGTLIEGESLLNDGTAIVVFDVFFEAVEHEPCDPQMPGPGEVFIFLARLGALGPVVGCLVGFVCTSMLGYVLNDPFNEISITIIACFGSFGVAEGLVGTSGVLSVVCCGLWLSRYGRGRISADVESSMHSFWAVLAHIANTAVFFLTGLIMTARVFRFRKRVLGEDCLECENRHDHEAEHETSCHKLTGSDFGYLAALYVAVHVIRALVVFLSSPVLRASAYGFSLKESVVVVFGGLRGAIALLLALFVAESEEGLEDILQTRILFQVSGMVLLIVCIDGSAMRHVLHALGLDKSTEAEDEVFAHVSLDIEKTLAADMETLKQEQFFGDADWAMVWRYVPVLSSDAYWVRIRDGRLQLSEPEQADLRDWASTIRANKTRGDGRRFVPFFEKKFGKRVKEYPVPPRLRHRWSGYHKKFGNSAPRFLHLAPGETIRRRRLKSLRTRMIRSVVARSQSMLNKFNDDDRLHSTEKDTFDDILDAVSLSSATLRREKRDQQQLAVGSTLASQATKARLTRLDRAMEAKQQQDSTTDQEDDVTVDGSVKPAIVPAVLEEGQPPPPAGKGTPVRTMLKRVIRSMRSGSKHFDVDDEDVETGSAAIGGSKQKIELEVVEEVLDEEVESTKASLAVRAEARTRCLWHVKANFNSAFARGRLSSAGLRVLRENTALQLDDASQPLCGWEELVETEISRLTFLDSLRALRVWIPLSPIRRLLDGYVFSKTAFLFETAYNFIKAYGDVDVEEVVDHGPDKIQLAAEIASQRKLAKTTVDQYVDVFPEVANAVKTQVASRYVLVLMQRLVQDLHDHGALNETELEEAVDKINTSRIKLDLHPPQELMPSVEKLLSSRDDLEVPFLGPLSREDLSHLVSETGQIRSEIQVAGTVLARRGRLKLARRGELHGRQGWFLIARGTVSVLDDENDDSHAIMLGAGSLCCLEEQILGIPFTATVTAISIVHLVFFDLKAMLALSQKNDALRRRLWWTVAERVLRESPSTHSISSRNLRRLAALSPFVEVPDDDLNEQSNRSSLTRALGSIRRRPSQHAGFSTPDSTSQLRGLEDSEEKSTQSVIGDQPPQARFEATDSPFCLVDGAEEHLDRPEAEGSHHRISTSTSHPDLVHEGASDLNSVRGTSSTTIPRNNSNSGMKNTHWSKLKNVVMTASEFRRHKKLDAEDAAMFEKSEEHRIPNSSVMILLKGCAFLHLKSGIEEIRAVHAIAKIAVDDDTHYATRSVHLAPGSKAFIVAEEDILT